MAEGPLPGTVRPSNEAVFKAAQALVSLVSQHLPQRFYQTERRWRSYGVAMVARMADILESLLVLMNAGRQMDGAALVRVLYEHVVKYCWIAIDPDEHLPRWSSDALYWERKLHDDLAEYGQGFLSREELERETYASAKQLPKMIELAEQVDQHWGGRLDAFIPAGKGPLGIFTLRGFYNAVYRTLSEPVHARPEALRANMDLNSYPRRVSCGEITVENTFWWPLPVRFYGQALVVCHAEVGWPEPERITSIHNGMYE